MKNNNRTQKKNYKKRKNRGVNPISAIFKLILMGGASFLLIFIAVKAAPPLSPYSPGETVDPVCDSITDTNCTVTTPAISGANTDITSLGGLTSVGITSNDLNFGSGTLYIDDSGKIGIGTTTPQTIVQVGPTNAGQTGYGTVGVQITVDNNSGGRWQALRGDSWVTSGTGLGVNGTAGGVGATENIGLYAWAEGASTANYGGQFWSYQHNNNSTVTNNYGVYVSNGIYTGKSGNITNAYGFYGRIINNGTGTITNGYGLYLADTTATNDYGIYQAGTNDDNYFAGKIGVGTTSIRANSTLDVNGIVASIKDMDWIGYYVGESETVGGGFSWRNTLNRVDISSVGYGYPIDISGSSLSLQGASSGNVGIGTTSPAYNLDVSGTAHVSGVLASEANYDPIDDGLVLYFPFAEGTGTTVYDRSKYGNDTTSFEGTPTWITTGKFGNAMSFNGNDVDGTEYIEIPDSSSLDVSSAMTIEAWIYPVAFPDPTAISQYSLISDKRVTYTQAAFWFGLNNLDRPHFCISTNGTVCTSADGPEALSLNQWYHFVGTYDGSYVRSYINGVLVGTSAEISGAIYNSPAAMRIGAGHDQDMGGLPVSFTYFNGKIDEFKLYNRALMADEVREHYERGLGQQGVYSDLVTGNVGVNTTSPLTKLDVAGSGRLKGTATSVLMGSIDTDGDTSVTGVGTAFTKELIVGDRLKITGMASDEIRTVTAIASDTSLTVDSAFSDNANDTSPEKLAAEFVVKDSDDNVDMVVSDQGYVGIGTAHPWENLVVASSVDADFDLSLAAINDSPSMHFRRAHGTIETPAIPTNVGGNWDEVGKFEGEVYDSTAYKDIAAIVFDLDGVPAAGDVPGRIEFYTTPDGAAVKQIRMVIKNNGNVGIGVADPDEKLEVVGHYKASGAAPALSSCGVTPAIIAGADSAGKITIGSGPVTSCTVTFATAFAQAPACIASGDNPAVGYATTTTATTLTITSSADMASDVISYICFGNGS